MCFGGSLRCAFKQSGAGFKIVGEFFGGLPGINFGGDGVTPRGHWVRPCVDAEGPGADGVGDEYRVDLVWVAGTVLHGDFFGFCGGRGVFWPLNVEGGR